jgi:hypothetical protein
MNERIRELAVENGIGYLSSVHPSMIEKFAELLIRECAEQIMLKGTDWMDWAPSQQAVRPEYVEMAKHIKQHFGVER